MNNKWRNIGLIALAAGVLYYPALRMYRMATANKEEEHLLSDDDKAKHIFKKSKNHKRGHNSNNSNMGIA